MSLKIVSTGSYYPKNKVSNFDLEKIMDTNDAWIQKRTGIETRYYEDTSTSHMALHAAKDALKDIDLESIDCIVVGTYTPDDLIPTVANTVRKELGIKKNIPAFDINAACSGFIFAFHTARAFIKSKIYKRVLVIGVDFNSRIMDFTDRKTSILFGDGAGCVLLEYDKDNLCDSYIHSVSDTQNSLTAPSSSDFSNPFVERDTKKDPFFKMEGQAVFRFAVDAMNKGINEVLKKNDLKLDDIDYVISHQANQRIMETSARMLKGDPNKFLSNIKEYGNTSSGSVPLLLDEANKKGYFKPGMKLILVAFGGGLSYGSVLIQWT